MILNKTLSVLNFFICNRWTVTPIYLSQGKTSRAVLCLSQLLCDCLSLLSLRLPTRQGRTSGTLLCQPQLWNPGVQRGSQSPGCSEGLNEFPGLLCDYCSGLYLCIVSSFDLDPSLKGTDGTSLSNHHLKGKTGSTEPWTLLPYFELST